MMTRLVLLLALTLALAPCAHARSSSSSSQSASSSHSSSSSHSDQDDAREALRKGKVMPLTAILEIVAKREPGTVMEVELETKNGRLVYRIEVLADSGRRRELRLDAASGEILRVKDD